MQYTIDEPEIKPAIPEFVKRQFTDTPQQRLTLRLGKRDGWRCFYCGYALASPEVTRESIISYEDEEMGRCYYAVLPDGVKAPTVDHKIPSSKGGTNDLLNLVLACNDCNTQKNNRHTAEEFLARKRREALQ